MKDILKILGTYFALGFGTIFGIGAGMKACDKLFNKETVKETTEKDKVIKFIKESE